MNSFYDRKVYLESKDGQLIKMELQEILVGQLQLTQAVFKPSQCLLPNTTYSIKYENQTEMETREMYGWDSDTESREKIQWTTQPTINSDYMTRPLKINYITSEVNYYGCGPEAYAIFEIENPHTIEKWYKVTLVDLSTHEESIYIITAYEGKLYIGHGMCAGPFVFNSNGKYKLKVSQMDLNGKYHPPTPWITFQNPYEDHPSPWSPF
ncbi:hypothetical protein [Echinicola rosea]|uniref:hypothetical protein n=1 Tax=Echinicola rosea TaxID=1807691 RepID=UPI0010CA92E5|nr:hypothetical protein [Echinicola rosea]